MKPVVEKPFGDLVQFFVRRRAPMARKVLLVAPMSGHYATLAAVDRGQSCCRMPMFM